MPTAAVAQTDDEPGQLYQEVRDAAQELLPIEAVVLRDGFLTIVDVADFRRLPVVDEKSAREVGLRAQGVRLTHLRRFQSLDSLTFVDIQVSYIDDFGIAESYIAARRRNDRAYPAPLIASPAVMVKPADDAEFAFRSVFAAQGNLLASAVGKYGDGAEQNFPALEDMLQRLVVRQLELQGSDNWRLLDSLLDREPGLSPDYAAFVTRLLFFAPFIAGVVLLFIKAITAVLNPVSRYRLYAKLRIGQRGLVQAREEIVDVSPVSRRRRRASWAFTLRKWLLVPFGFVVVFFGGFSLVFVEPDRGRAVVIIANAAVGIIVWRGVGWVIRRAADMPTPDLSRMDARPPGYGALGRRISLPFIGVFGVSGVLVIMGSVLLFGSSISLAIAGLEQFELFPKSAALGEFNVGIPLGFLLIATASGPLEWLRSRRNTSLSLVAEGDARRTVLLLRSFNDDSLRLTREIRQKVPLIDRLRFRQRVGYEDVLVRRLWLTGAVVAVGEPGSRPPSLGATRAFLGNDWTTSVRVAIDSSRLVALSIGNTQGITWELGQLEQAAALGKAVFIVPPTTDSEARLARVVEILRIPNPPDPMTTPLVVTVEPYTRVATYYCDYFRGEAAYTAALDHAVLEALGRERSAFATQEVLQQEQLPISSLPPPPEPTAAVAASATILQFPVASTVSPGSRRRTRSRRLPKISWLSAVAVVLLLPVLIHQVSTIIGSDEFFFETTLAAPTAVYSKSHKLGQSTALWGADYLILEQHFTIDDIKPLAVDYNATNSRVGVLERTGSLLVLNDTTGDQVAVLAESPGGRSMAWVGSSLVVTYPADQSILIWDPGKSSERIDLDFKPLVVANARGQILVSSKGGGVHFLRPDGQVLETVATSHTVGHINKVGERFVLTELVTGSTFELNIDTRSIQLVTTWPGEVIPLDDDSFLIYNGSSFLQYQGLPFTAVRTSNGPSATGVLSLFGRTVTHFGNDGTIKQYPICDGLICTKNEFSNN